jgi:hypothetical protein
LGHLFMSRPGKDQDPVQHTKAVIRSGAEVGTLAALKSRQSSTLFPELRKAWMGSRSDLDTPTQPTADAGLARLVNLFRLARLQARRRDWA